MDTSQLRKRMSELSTIIHEKRSALETVEDIYIRFDSCCSEEREEYDSIYRTIRLNETPTYCKFPDYGTKMTLEEFIDNVKSGGFIDYDGCGNYSMEYVMSDITIYPSDIVIGEYRKDFTHVIWFNR